MFKGLEKFRLKRGYKSFIVSLSLLLFLSSYIKCIAVSITGSNIILKATSK